MRFWLVVALFAVLNLAAWLATTARSWSGPSRAQVVETARHDGDALAVGQDLWWRFDRAMAAFDLEREPPARIVPAAQGRWRWRDEKTLVFEPSTLPTASPFLIEFVPGHLVGRDGREARTPPPLHLHAPALTATGCRAVGSEEGGRYVLELGFSEAVAPASALARLHATDAWGRDIALALWGGGDPTRVRVITEPLAERRDARDGVHLAVRLDAGLVGIGGPLGLERDASWQLLLDPALRLDQVRVGADGASRLLELEFNHPCGADVLRRVLALDPALPFTLTGSGSAWTIAADFAWGQRYAVVVSPPAPGAPAADYPRPDRLSASMPERAPAAWFEHDTGYLGSSGNRAVLAHAVNLRQVTVEAWRLYDSNLVSWRTTGRWQLENLARPVAERTIVVPAGANADHDLRLALDELLPEDARGDGVYRLTLRWRGEDELGSEARGDRWGWRGREVDCVIGLSDIGLQARSGPDGIDAWCWSLGCAAPLPGTRVRLYSSKNQQLAEAICDADGRAHLALVKLPRDERAAVLVADRHVADEPDGLTWLDLGENPVRDALAETGGRGWIGAGHEAFIYGDRGVYRPGDTAHLRALVRAAGGRVPAPFPVRWRILRPDLRVWREIVALLPDNGDAGLDLELPADLPTGRWTAQLGLPGDATPFGATTLQVEEFMPQRLKVALDLGSAERWALATGAPSAKVRGDYLFGSPAAGLEARLSAHLDPSRFAPKAWAEWTFEDAGGTAGTLDHATLAGERLDPKPIALGADGGASWPLEVAERIARLGPTARRPWRLTASASVLEPGGRAVTTGAKTIELDPLTAYLGARLIGAAHDGMQRFELRAVRADATIDDAAQRAITVDLLREEWNTTLVREGRYYRYQSQRDLVAVGAERQLQLTDGAAGGEVAVPDGGSYVLRLRDSATGQLVSLPFYAGGDEAGWRDSVSREHPDRCEVLVAPREESPPAPPQLAKSLRVGATAEITVRSPFPGRLLLVVETDRIVATRCVTMTENAVTVALPVERDWLPNAYVTATVVRAVEPDQPWRVHRVFGVARAPVVDWQRRMTVAIAAPGEARPGSRLGLDLALSDAAGTPIAGGVATVAVVDEGVLRLTGFATPDPYAWFTAPRGRALTAFDCYDELMPEVARPGGESPAGGDAGPDLSRYRPPIAARRVRSVALWSGEVHAARDGRAHVDFDLPATFTGALRVMAVADRGAVVGSAEASVAVRAPLMVQASWPRFAAPGDSFRVPVTIFNRGAQPGRISARIAVPAEDPLACAEPEREVEVPAGSEATIAFTVAAKAQCGVAHARIVARLGEEEARDEVELPVRPPSPTVTVGSESRATTAHSATAEVPGGFLPGTVALDARLAPLPALSLPAGLEYLYRYPYGCAEQTVSGCFPLLCLRDIGATVAPRLFSADGVADRLRIGIDRLQAMQTEDGGLAMWAGGREPWPWASVYAAHFLVEARTAKVAVPEDFLARLLTYVRRLGARADDAWIETQCYAAYVLALAGLPDQALMHRLEEALAAHDVEQRAGPSCRFHLSAAWLAAGRRDLAVELLPEALPQLTRPRRTDGDLASPVRDRAVMLSTLLDVDPDHGALPRLAQELADRSTWLSTQDTAFAMLALGKYLRHAAKDAPYQVAHLRVDGADVASAKAGEALTWQGRTATALSAIVDAPAAAAAWFSWTETGVPLAMPPPADHGLRIERSWRDSDRREKTRFVSGDLVRVELVVRSASERRGVALEDLLPAGFEIENPRLEGSAERADDGRIDVRDDRIVAFGDLHACDGEWRMTRSYLVRAVTAGHFAAPPARAECMYDIGVNGIGQHGTVEVERRP